MAQQRVQGVQEALRRVVVPFQGRYIISKPDKTEVRKDFPPFEYLRDELLPRYRKDFGASLLVLAEMTYECAPDEYPGLVEEFSKAAADTGVGIIVGIDEVLAPPSGKGRAPAIRRMVYTPPRGETRSILSFMEAVQIVTDLPGFPDKAGWEIYRPIPCDGFTFCLSICMDFRYLGPALAWKAFKPDILINGAGWNFPREKWSTILRGRAMDIGGYALTVVQDIGVPPKAAELFYGPDGRERGFKVIWRPEVIPGPSPRFPELYQAMTREELDAWYAFEPCAVVTPEGEKKRGTRFKCFYLLPNGNGSQEALFPLDETLLASKVPSPLISVLEPEVVEAIQTKFLRGKYRESKDADFYLDPAKQTIGGQTGTEVKLQMVAGQDIFNLEKMARLHLDWMERGFIGKAPILLVNVWKQPLDEDELWRLYHITRLRSYEGCLGVAVLTPEACWGVQPTAGGAGPPQVLYPDDGGRLWFSRRRVIFRVGNQNAFMYDDGQEQRFRERYPRWIKAVLNRENGWRG